MTDQQRTGHGAACNIEHDPTVTQCMRDHGHGQWDELGWAPQAQQRLGHLPGCDSGHNVTITPCTQTVDGKVTNIGWATVGALMSHGDQARCTVQTDRKTCGQPALAPVHLIGQPKAHQFRSLPVTTTSEPAVDPAWLDRQAIAMATDFVTRVVEYGRLNRQEIGVPGPMEIQATALRAALKARLDDERPRGQQR